MSKQDRKPKIVLIFSIVLMLFLSFLLYVKSNEKQVLGMSDENNEILSLQKYLAYNPDYLPGWIKLYEISKEYNLEEIEKNSLKNIKRLDPNFTDK